MDGPLQGLLVEANGHGGLRGYTNTKIINDADEADHTDVAAILGMGADVQVIRSLPTRILDQAQLRVVPPSIQVAVAKYFNQSMQIPTAVDIAVASDKEAITYARGIAIQRMPDSDQAAFIRAVEAFNDGRVHAFLEAGTIDIDALAECIGLPDLAISRTREMRFECRCSRAKVIASLTALSLEERMEMLAEKEAHHIVCHLCGEDYVIENSDIPPPV
jgi:molecular chaperone Hsp33